MRVVTSEEMQQLDQTTIKDIGIPGVVLMENAGLKVVESIKNILEDVRGKTVTVFAGKGNNGGDGFVVARHLLNMGAEVRVLIFGDPKEIKGDAGVNLGILTAMGHKVHSIMNVNSVNIVKLSMVSTDLVVDAVFGTGFKGAVDEHVGNIIEIINGAGKPVVAVDIPSGLEANTGKAHGPCIRATHTVTFGLPKTGLLVYPGVGYAGELIVADISIPPAVIEKRGISKFLLTPGLVQAWLPKRQPESHKGTYGRVAVIGGAEGMTGAAALAGMAALRAGAGLVTLGLPRSLHGLMEVKLTEVMTRPLPETDQKTISRDALTEVQSLVEWADVVAVGPGISTEPATRALVRDLITELKKPAVIDADGLNALAGHTEILEKCQAPLVLTPHPGEMAGLLGIKTSEVQDNRIEVVTAAAQKWGATVVLKGARTLIAASDGSLYINPTGNPGMATGGSGDVLTGVIAGLMAQGLSPVHAAAAGAFFHGLAGDQAGRSKGEPGLVAGDILDALLAARDRETGELAGNILELLLTNANIASRDRIPVCQDTGTGIAPFRSFLQSPVVLESHLPVTLLLGARYEESLLYRSEFEDLERTRPGFQFLPTITRPSPSWQGRTGRVQAHIDSILGSRTDLDVYICGLRAMVDEVRSLLASRGFEKNRIIYEKYD